MKSSWLWARVRWSVEGVGKSLEAEFNVALGDIDGADFNPLNSEDFWAEQEQLGQQLKGFGRHNKALTARILNYATDEVVGAERASSRFESHNVTLEIREGRMLGR